MKVVSQEFYTEVPLDYSGKSRKKMKIYGRLYFKKGNEKKDIFVFLQGGPGHECFRSPEQYPCFKQILKKFRLLMVDQRGTGKSSLVDRESPVSSWTGVQQRDFLELFRADSIIRDLEYIRQNRFKNKKWYLHGQSYGGFLSFHYLSFYPEALKGVLITGGVPPIGKRPLEVYERFVDNIYKKNKAFYKAFPKDKDRVKKIYDILKKRPMKLFQNYTLTAERFRDIGFIIGRPNGFQYMHDFLDLAFLDSTEKQVSYTFARSCLNYIPWDDRPIYASLHESIYCDGPMKSNWACENALNSHGSFGAEGDFISFYGESIQKDYYKAYPGLRPFAKSANLIAQKNDWSDLYNLERLNANKVPVVCAIFDKDYYVDRDFSLEVLKQTRKSKSITFKDYEHGGAFAADGVVFNEIWKKLFN